MNSFIIWLSFIYLLMLFAKFQIHSSNIQVTLMIYFRLQIVPGSAKITEIV